MDRITRNANTIIRTFFIVKAILITMDAASATDSKAAYAAALTIQSSWRMHLVQRRLDLARAECASIEAALPGSGDLRPVVNAQLLDTCSSSLDRIGTRAQTDQEEQTGCYQPLGSKGPAAAAGGQEKSLDAAAQRDASMGSSAPAASSPTERDGSPSPSPGSSQPDSDGSAHGEEEDSEEVQEEEETAVQQEVHQQEGAQEHKEVQEEDDTIEDECSCSCSSRVQEQHRQTAGTAASLPAAAPAPAAAGEPQAQQQRQLELIDELRGLLSAIRQRKAQLLCAK
jgi:hypothetical protein